MESIYFKESTVELKKPQSMSDEECRSLHIMQTPDGQCISLWKATFFERLKFLFHGKIWLGIISGKTQPPVWVDISKTIFIEESKP
jgi:hypothetical protein